MLSIKEITFRISNKLSSHISLTIHPTDIIGILGPNGCGKTTFLHTLAGLHPLQNGTIFLDNNNILHISPKTRAKKLGLLFQDTQCVFPQTVLEYCLAGRYPHLKAFSRGTNKDYAIAKNALALMELDHLITQNIMTLSGGEKRRLALATLLTQTPEIYLLDEPTNHLDLRHQIKCLEYFYELANNEGKSIMMSLHDINLAQRYCNKVILMFADGGILTGTSEELLTSENLSLLYQHPLHSVNHENHKIWLTIS